MYGLRFESTSEFNAIHFVFAILLPVGWNYVQLMCVSNYNSSYHKVLHMVDPR